MKNPDKTEWPIKNGKSRENQWAIKNGKSRENKMGNQEWTIHRKPNGQSRMDNPEKTEWAINSLDC
jgi:hypothetical protein